MNTADGTGGDVARIRLSDDDRIHAMSVLGTHFADGRLDDHEFNERSGAVAEARTIGDLDTLFDDLPGGLPFDGAGRQVAAPGQELDSGVPDASGVTSVLAGRDPELAEVENLRRRGNLVQSIDGAVLGVTLVTFLLLQFVFDVSYAWVVWPSLVVTLSVPRMLLKYSDEDEELFEEIKEADQETRKERLRRAAERMHELESRDKRDRD